MSSKATGYGTALMLTVLVLLTVACAGRPAPQALPPQTMAPPAPETGEEPLSNIAETAADTTEPLATGMEPTPPPPTSLESPDFVMVEESPTTAENPEAARSDDPEDPLTVVLDPGTDEAAQPRSLFEASRAEKDRRQEVGESEIVLTNKTLKDYSKGNLTFMEGEEAEGEAAIVEESGETDETEDAETADADQEALDEEYWRNRVLDIRTLWRQSLDRMEVLESDIGRLRTEFYAEDDPFYRDAQIKPAWDQALIELEDARRDAETSQRDLEDAMEEGRRAGALPGWLREGIELEPTVEELEELQPPSDSRVHEPSEPVILEEDGGDDGG